MLVRGCWPEATWTHKAAVDIWYQQHPDVVNASHEMDLDWDDDALRMQIRRLQRGDWKQKEATRASTWARHCAQRSKLTENEKKVLWMNRNTAVKNHKLIPFICNSVDKTDSKQIDTLEKLILVK